MRIVPKSAVGREAWNAVVERSDEAWLFHRGEWTDIECRYFAERDLSFALDGGGEVLAIHPLYLAGPQNGLGFETVLHSGVHRLAGYCQPNDIDTGKGRTARAAAIRHVEDTARAFNVDRIHTGTQTAAPANRLGRSAKVPFVVGDHSYQLGMAFSPSGMSPCPGVTTLSADQQVALDADGDLLFGRLDESCRRAVRRAQKSGLTWSIGSAIERLDEYLALATLSSKRTGEQLPPIAYYRAIADAFDASGHVRIAITRTGEKNAAALILLVDKGCVSFLAGVSDPETLETRCNDHVHWETIRWARAQGHEVYRLGPSFPEVPRDWPIARVSAFKTKFGSISVPMTYASLYRHPEKYLANLPQRTAELAQVARTIEPPLPKPSLDTQIVTHLLSVFGLPERDVTGPLVLDRPTLADAGRARKAAAGGRAVVALRASRDFAATFDVSISEHEGALPSLLRADAAAGKPWGRLRTLHRSRRFSADTAAELHPIVTDADGAMAWAWCPHERSGVLFVGTELAGDIIRYRQGDPAAAANRPTEASWGIAGERPLYLYEAQLAGEAPSERHADWWCEALADALVRHGGAKRHPMLPGGAPGAIIVTGDDDQAFLETYAQQSKLLGSLPVTYFLHPLTKHTPETLAKLQKGRRVELGIHPDALEAPHHYDALFDEQIAWFEKLTGHSAKTVRNHGFLNDGYWGHAKVWSKHGVAGSSNLPGFDGRALNGSFLPGRLALDGTLTDHWSVLTTIGDGVVFIHGWDDQQSAACIHKVAKDIRASGVPGIIVLNLHPQNVDKTAGMHHAARELAVSGFVAWTLSECLDWFSGPNLQQTAPMPASSGLASSKLAASKQLVAALRPAAGKARRFARDLQQTWATKQWPKK